MRSFISPLLLGLCLLTAFTSALTFSASCMAEICGEDLSPRALEPTPTAAVPRELTNGQRLSLGLPLKSPSRRRRGSAVAARTAQVSATPQYTVTGVIQVNRASDGGALGTIDENNNPNGMISYSTTISSALKVQISLNIGETAGSGVEITTVNSAVGPLLGLVQGRDSTTVDIASGSYNYLYLNGIDAPGTEACSVPITQTSRYSSDTGRSRAAETSVWNIDLTTGAMSVQWTNSDSSAPPTVVFSQSGYLYAGGDKQQFYNRYPAPVTGPLTFTFVADATGTN